MKPGRRLSSPVEVEREAGGESVEVDKYSAEGKAGQHDFFESLTV